MLKIYVKLGVAQLKYKTLDCQYFTTASKQHYTLVENFI